jgi:FMN-binding protein
VCAILAALAAVGAVRARVEMTQDEALRLAFPPPQEVERRTLYLDDAQAKQAGAAAGVPVDARVVPYYVGRAGGRLTGFAYFDTHLVRTLPETVMIRLTPDGAIQAIDILSFDEPQDYRVTARWLEQFKGQDAAAAPRLPVAIRSLSGATLSARAVTDAARRILALHHLFVATQAQTSAPGSPP